MSISGRMRYRAPLKRLLFQKLIIFWREKKLRGWGVISNWQIVECCSANSSISEKNASFIVLIHPIYIWHSIRNIDTASVFFQYMSNFISERDKRGLRSDWAIFNREAGNSVLEVWGGEAGYMGAAGAIRDWRRPLPSFQFKPTTSTNKNTSITNSPQPQIPYCHIHPHKQGRVCWWGGDSPQSKIQKRP